jgi:hypothetical protein
MSEDVGKESVRLILHKGTDGVARTYTARFDAAGKPQDIYCESGREGSKRRLLWIHPETIGPTTRKIFQMLGIGAAP